MLTTNKNIKEYFLNLQKNSFEDLIEANCLKYIFADIFPLNKEEIKARSLNRMFFLLKQNSLSEICDKLEKQSIKYISFKGVILSHFLYHNFCDRYIGDLDIYVSPKDFELGLATLFKLGYRLVDETTLFNQHHVVLHQKQIIIELHKNIFNPLVNIDEGYLLQHIDKKNLLNSSISTFTITATFLHLIYHLYMDTWLTCFSPYSILTNQKLWITNRFLYRAYEIALFSEKYFNEINWNDITTDIKKQKLRVVFKKMILDILDVFPDAFPENFIDTVLKLDYIYDGTDHLYYYLMETKTSTEKGNIDNILCNYIDNHWNLRKGNNIHKHIGESFKITKISATQEFMKKLRCDVETKKLSNGIALTFTVWDDDFYFSDINNFDTQASDGVHLLLCGTEDFSYNSIFFFPKYINNEIKVIPCNVLHDANSIFDTDLIKTIFSKAENGYTITAMLSNKFMVSNHIDHYFYMGLVISSCDSKTKRRNDQLMLSEIVSEWYNPIYFAKITM